MKRRHLLAAVGVASVSSAGCLGAGMPRDAVVSAEQESPPASATVVSYDALPQAERQIARTAIEDDFYHACPELPGAIRSFAERFEGPDDAYLTYRETSYGMWIRIEDTIRAGTAPPPDADPSCGFF
ncbi:hypothetical protein [Haloferax sp. YSSS75]|uniref:hypothetical protein n=1 Tax=Haloferax sp. YSSS75 TaxID=3388564 RepID=UPI00398CFF9B